jgi:hypothetical protein
MEKLQLLRHNAIASVQQPISFLDDIKGEGKTRHGMIGLCAFHQPRHLRGGWL